LNLPRLALVGAWLCAVSCRQVIGIEPADEDPSLIASADGGTKSALGEAAAGQESELVAGAASSAGGEAALGDTGSAGEAGASAAGAAGATTPCERYCTTVMANCTGSFAVYGSPATCLALCGFMPEGAEGDRSGNSVQCRLHAAQAAPSEVPHYCPIAGPGGNGVCGSNCESLCQLRAGVCADYSDGDEESCLTACKKLEDRPTYSTDPSVGLYSGAHVQCRLYHLSAAASDDPAGHCQHVDGEPPCQ
jgi:hypothetical protein